MGDYEYEMFSENLKMIRDEAGTTKMTMFRELIKNHPQYADLYKVWNKRFPE